MRLRLFVAILTAFGIGIGAAAAQDCAELPNAAALPADGPEFLAVQQTLGSALGVRAPMLEDGRRGPVSDQALVDLCEAVPMPQGSDRIAQTLALLKEYAWLRGLVPDWQMRVSAPDLAVRLAAADAGRIVLGLAAAPEVTGAVLMGSPAGQGDACTGVPDLDAQAATGLAAIEAAGLLPTGMGDAKARFCAAYPSLDGADGLVDALARFGQIETQVPGAMKTLAAPAMRDWLLADQAHRLRRLVGTPASVQQLLADFMEVVPAPAPPAPRPEPKACQINPDLVRYWSFGAAETARLTLVDSARPALEALIGPAAGPEAIESAITTALTGDMSDCLRARITDLVRAPDSPARTFVLDPDGVQQLGLEGALAERQAVVDALLGSNARTRAALLAGTEGALMRTLRASLDTEIAATVAIIADAAEVLPAFTDRPGPGMPEPQAAPFSDTLIVTDLTRETAQAGITNPAFLEAFLAAAIRPALNRTLLEADLRAVLAPVAQRQIDTISASDMARIEALVRLRWAITPDLVEAVLALPELASAGVAEADLAQTLVGLEYPTEALMQQALAVVEPALPKSVQDSALHLSAKVVADPSARRVSGTIVDPDCGCVMRRENHAMVYGFYPFWLFPTEPAPDTAPAAGAAPAGTGTAPADASAPEIVPQPAKVNFELVERIAFYGLQWSVGAQTGVLELRHMQQWRTHRRDFVNSALRQRAKADLAIRLTGWAQWSEDEIEQVVATTDQMMNPFRRYDLLTVEESRRFLPTLFDAAQPSGLTLIIDDYDGRPDHPDSERLVALINRIAQPLSSRGQSLHLGLTLDLDGTASSQGLFADLGPLLEAAPGGESTVDKLLIFLEQPTTQSARILRQGLDGGSFRAETRTEILRRILPVIAPAGERIAQAGDQMVPGDPDSPATQFLENLIYFQDNFGGVGFWPVPLADDPGDMAIASIVMDTWDLWRLPAELESIEVKYDAVCAFVCPNRIYLSATASVIALLTVVLIVWSFYSGTGDRIAFRWHFVTYGNVSLLGLLVLLSSCDQAAFLPPIFLVLLAIVLLVALLFNTYHNARNGPNP